MAELHFDFRDIFRAGRYGFNPKMISVHLFGLILAYIIYEILVYASLFIAGGSAVRQFWDTYALLPVCPLVDYAFEDLTIGAMWLGTFLLFVFFFLTSTMVSKITIEQLRGRLLFFYDGVLGFCAATLESSFRDASGLGCYPRAFGFSTNLRWFARQDSNGGSHYLDVRIGLDPLCLLYRITNSLSPCRLRGKSVFRALCGRCCRFGYF